MTIWVLTPTWIKPPLSMNDRGGWRTYAVPISRVRREANLLARATGIPAVGHLTVKMVWTVPDRKKRDNENPMATMKPFCDGLVDAGLVPDDVPAYMTKLMPVIEYRKGERGVRFELTDSGDICSRCGTSMVETSARAVQELRTARPGPITPGRP